MTFPEAGIKDINTQIRDQRNRDLALKTWNQECTDLSLKQAQELANNLGFILNFDWEACRSEEGFYKIKGNLQYAVKRGLKFGEIADMVWMETPTPDLQVAQDFADQMKAGNPNLMLAYNLSPSFNWEAANLTDAEIKKFIPKLAAMGYAWQFITLAGFHLNALMTEILTRDFAKKDMLSYVNMIQRREKTEKVDQLKHQKWSGVELRDKEMEIASPFTVSTKATADGNTEVQFEDAKL